MKVVFFCRSGKIKKRHFIFFIVILLAVIAAFLIPEKIRPAVLQGMPLTGKVIVIDPGHGGYDPGVYVNGLKEKEVNLAISFILRDYLQGAGARVVMTRESDRDLLLLPAAGPKKKQDMKNRLFIIHSVRPDMVISVHTNAISSARWRGAQVFHSDGNEEGQKLAAFIQQELIRVMQNTNRPVKTGDFLILNEVDVPAVIIETGFLSNPEEAQLLADDRYRSRLAWSVYLGITRYYSAYKKSY